MKFKNKRISKSSEIKPIEPVIINILAIAGILSNTAGLILSMVFASNHGNTLPTALCLCFQLIVWCFRKKLPYSVTAILLTAGCTNVLFPLILLADKKGLSGSFVFYLFIAPVAYGVSLNKKRWLFVPFLTLLEYLAIFTYIDCHVFNPGDRNIVLYNTSFSVGYSFVFFFTYFFANISFTYNEKLLKLTYHDELTQLYNRRKLDNDLKNKHFRFIAMIDIDNFHECNNEHGHQFGDLCLKKLADICLFVSSDEFKVYRYGGEEFVILSRLGTQDTITKIKNIQNLYYQALGITVSVGVAQNADYLTYKQVVKQADENMFFVKQHGKNGISLDGVNLVKS